MIIKDAKFAERELKKRLNTQQIFTIPEIEDLATTVNDVNYVLMMFSFTYYNSCDSDNYPSMIIPRYLY